MKHKVILLGEPGVSKTTCGLSYPGVEQHVWGSNEEDTALGFKGRTDILPFLKYDWRDCLKDTERDELTASGKDDQLDILDRHRLMQPGMYKAKARNVARYFDYLEKLSVDLKAGKRKEVQAVFVDNLTPLTEDIWTYTEILHSDDYTEKTMFKLHMDYQNYLTKLIDLLVGLPIHTIASCHVQMALDEATSSTNPFMIKDPTRQAQVMAMKEWQPYIMGKYKFRLAAKFSFAFFLFTEENPGLATKYLAKLEADSKNVGVAKARVQPFDNPHKIVLPKGTFYQFLEDALKKQQDSK